MSDAPAIQVTDVVRAFDRGVIRALDGVTLTVGRGEYVALMGPSGCGKSTLLHLIADLDTPDAGTIVVEGRDLRDVDGDRYRRREVGLIFQLHNLLPQLTALQNVEVAMFGNGHSHADQRTRARELLDAVGLAPRERTKPTLLAGGERQRVAIARALANEPPVLLADEPTGSLDAESGEAVIKLLFQLNREAGTTLVMVTHDELLARRCQRVVRLAAGRIVA
jgi:putative ABC transport system ATP-binding protein